ncbi:hypothetical protein TNCV_1646401 [Trichonephila clavipes]|nr:hypothetical protein TNCV_1646401 [Trichonephila clavipes]
MWVTRYLTNLDTSRLDGLPLFDSLIFLQSTRLRRIPKSRVLKWNVFDNYVNGNLLFIPKYPVQEGFDFIPCKKRRVYDDTIIPILLTFSKSSPWRGAKVPVQMWSLSLDHGSKLRDPLPIALVLLHITPPPDAVDDEPEPSAPPLELMDKVRGYESASFEADKFDNDMQKVTPARAPLAFSFLSNSALMSKSFSFDLLRLHAKTAWLWLPQSASLTVRCPQRYVHRDQRRI